jgi:hypothetical protein
VARQWACRRNLLAVAVVDDVAVVVIGSISLINF